VIGSYTSVASNVKVFLGGNHRHDWISTFPFAMNPTAGEIHGKRPGVSPRSNGDVSIGCDVWLGSYCSIMSGVTIGHGAVVAAMAHVVKDVSPFEIVGGNPAGHIGWRFDPPARERLLEIRWWDWPTSVVIANHHILTAPPSSDSLAELERIGRALSERMNEANRTRV